MAIASKGLSWKELGDDAASITHLSMFEGAASPEPEILKGPSVLVAGGSKAAGVRRCDGETNQPRYTGYHADSTSRNFDCQAV